VHAEGRVQVAREVPLPVVYAGVRIERDFRVDFVVEDCLVLEIKSVERLLPIHDAQILTYLKLSAMPQGLLINFNVVRLKDGVKSFLNTQGKP
jgi:GxxExxY protein